MSNGYSKSECKRWLSSHLRNRQPQSDQKVRRFHGSIPYVRGASERISSILGQVDIRVGMRPPTTLRSLLTRKRPQPAATLGSVYKIPCAEEGCGWSYVGETGRTLEERRREHRLAVRNLDSERSEVARHTHEDGHRVNIDSMHILEKEPIWRRRLVKEALWTKKLNSANRTKHFLSAHWDFIASS